MCHLAIYLLALAALRPARALGVGLQDLASLPKYQVDFLNDLPLAESDAAAIRTHGLSHEDQFLALRPGRASRTPAERDTIDGGEDGSAGDGPDSTGVRKTDELDPVPVPAADRIPLMPMLYTHPATPDLGPHTYLCALPSANTTLAQTFVEEAADEPAPDPEASWRALSHLDGQCLYLRLPHSWFTYAYASALSRADSRYCHNKDIRQFREKPVPHPHPEGFVPQADTAYPAYTLGVAHARSDNEVSETTASFGQSHASRYLVQRWTDGTPCDLTSKPREIEVQVYCSMTGTDMIYMVNEVAICHYVMVIHSPHLCSLPGFRPAAAADITPAPVRCREVVPDDEFAEWAERRSDRPRIGEMDEDARLASHESDPELKIEGLKGVRQEDLEAILRAAFGGVGKKKAQEEEGTEEPPEAGGAGEPELYVVDWEDTDGVRVPVDVESVTPTEGESRRAFLERLHALIEQELEAGKDRGGKDESGPASERSEQASAAGSEEQQHGADAPPIQRDEL